MHGAAEHTLDPNIRGLLEHNSKATLLLEAIEVTRPDESRPEAAAPHQAKRPKPAWWLLYVVVPVTALLFGLADLLSPTSGWRSASECLAALAALCAIGVWLRANRIALILSDNYVRNEGPPEAL